MAYLVACASCRRQLRVPEELIGQTVQCPTCGQVFQATRELLQLEAEPVEEAPEPPGPRERRTETYVDPAPPRIRRDLQAHRGPVILTLGILSMLLGCIGLILGPIALIMANNDLREIRAGRMDPEGESITNAGRICAIIGTILSVLGSCCCGGSFVLPRGRIPMRFR